MTHPAATSHGATPSRDARAVVECPRGAPAITDALRARLAIPVIAAPMFLVSGPELVIACCQAGVLGSFPTLNARTTALLDEWLTRIESALAGSPHAAPFAANLIVHRTNPRLTEDVDVVVAHRVPWVIASVGDPRPVIARVHAYGGKVIADVASISHARRALAAGVDGLILLTAGAGGNTGWMNPFAFVTAVREFYDGPLALAGAISRGSLVDVAERLGADFAVIGTPFVATRESMASEAYRQMLVDATADDIVLTSAVTGIPANMLRPCLERAGMLTPKGSGATPASQAAHAGGFDLTKEMETLKAWRDVWSAGHGVGDIHDVPPVAARVAALREDYLRARAA